MIASDRLILEAGAALSAARSPEAGRTCAREAAAIDPVELLGDDEGRSHLLHAARPLIIGMALVDQATSAEVASALDRLIASVQPRGSQSQQPKCTPEAIPYWIER